MSLKDLRLDILDIVDVSPSWLKSLSYNPIEDIVKFGKTHHLLYLLEDVFGFRKTNPILTNIRFFHYKNPYVEQISKDLKQKELLISKIKSNNIDSALDLLTLLARVNYFKVYSKESVDFLSKEIIKTNLIDRTSNLKYRAMLLFYISRLGYRNIFSDRCLKNLKECQNSDGSWSSDISSDSNESDIFTTLLIFRSFLMDDLWSGKKFLEKTKSYLSENHLSSNQTNEELDKWNRIYSGYKANNLFEGGSILLLESLLLCRNLDTLKIKAIVEWIKTLQFKNGYFPYHAKLKSEKNVSATIKILSLIKKRSLLLK